MDNLDQAAEQVPNILFVHCGGKHRMPSVVRALRAVSVPVCTSVDLDILQEEQLLRALVEEEGGDWTSLQDQWRTVKAAIDSEDRRPLRSYVKERLNSIVDQSTAAHVAAGEIDALRQVLRSDSGWQRVKRGGVAAVPQGDAFTACQDLLTQLATAGHLRSAGWRTRAVCP